MAVPAIIAAIEKGFEKTEKSEKREATDSSIPEKFGNNVNVADSIPEKFEVGSEKDNASFETLIPDKFEAQPYYSTYEERQIECKKSKGKWTGEVGESKLKPENADAKAKLSEFDKEDIEYKNGIPDFSPFAKDSVKIDHMTSSLIENKKQAFQEFADKWNSEGFEGKTNWSPRDVQAYKTAHNLDLHECSDLKTCQLVPHDIHMSAKHKGGRFECSVRDGERSKFDD